LDAGTITKLLSLFDCDQEVQDAAKAGSVGPTDWYAVARAKDQAEALRLKLTGATRDELERHIRAERCESQEVRTGADGRATSITLPLEDGVTFSVKGPGISIDAAIAHAEKAIAKLKQARGDGHTARTIKHWLKNKKPKKVKT
jgi:hypothetical protein